MIRFESVTKRYPDGTLAVDGLNLQAEAGQITVFVGPSGCGKTTSLRMINRMIEPTSGRIWLEDRDTATINVDQLRRGMGYVIQQGGLFPHRTVVDNIATVPVLMGESRRAARRRALELLERVGLPAALGDRYPAQLSGGQQQRVGVARALAADPPVMLMDEPFSAVDPGGARPAAGRVPPAAGGARQDHRLRHPRHRRGRQARRPGRGAARGGPVGAARHPTGPAGQSRRLVRRRLRRARPGIPGARIHPGREAAARTRRPWWRSASRSESVAERATDGWVLVVDAAATTPGLALGRHGGGTNAAS